MREKNVLLWGDFAPNLSEDRGGEDSEEEEAKLIANKTYHHYMPIDGGVQRSVRKEANESKYIIK